LANIVFNEPTVSRLHARIVEEEDGAFRIYDEGAANGTYVNYEPVTMAGQWLQHNDLINLGRVQLQFRLRGVSPEDEPTTPIASEAHPSAVHMDSDASMETGDTEPLAPYMPHLAGKGSPRADEGRTQPVQPQPAVDDTSEGAPKPTASG